MGKIADSVTLLMLYRKLNPEDQKVVDSVIMKILSQRKRKKKDVQGT